MGQHMFLQAMESHLLSSLLANKFKTTVGSHYFSVNQDWWELHGFFLDLLPREDTIWE